MSSREYGRTRTTVMQVRASRRHIDDHVITTWQRFSSSVSLPRRNHLAVKSSHLETPKNDVPRLFTSLLRWRISLPSFVFVFGDVRQVCRCIILRKSSSHACMKYESVSGPGELRHSTGGVLTVFIFTTPFETITATEIGGHDGRTHSRRSIA